MKAQEIQLKKLIEKRKEKRKSEIQEEVQNDKSEKKKKKKKHEEDDDDDSSNTVTTKKKKKRADEDEFEDTIAIKKSTIINGHDEGGDDTAIEKKKKKKRKQQDSDDEDSEEDEKTPKKKKRKKLSETDTEEENGNGTLENNNIDTGKDQSSKEDVSDKNKEDENFPVLRKQQRKSKELVKRNLPRWLSEPTIMNSFKRSNHHEMKLEDVDFLSQNTVNNLKKMKIDHLFPVQSCVIPTVVDFMKSKKLCFPCRDVCVQSPTGSGKTLAYVLPVVEFMSKNIIRDLQCLVVLPSKDLAAQVKATFDQCVVGTNLKVGLAAAVKSFAKEQDSIMVSRCGFFAFG